MSQVISTERLEEGMILGHDLSTSFGQLIAANGQELTQRLIHLIRSFGVTEVEIANRPIEVHPISPEQIRLAEEELEPWFQFTDRADPFIQEIFKSCLLRKARYPQGYPIPQEV